MEKLGNQSSGSETDTEGSEDLRGDNFARHHEADGAHPELEFLLQQSEPQNTETLHAENQNGGSKLPKIILAEGFHGSSKSVEISGVPIRHAANHTVFRHYPFSSSSYSYPVIDMRKAHRVGTLQFHKMRTMSSKTNELKLEVCQMFNAEPKAVHIIEEEGRKEEVILKTIIVILPPAGIEECCTLIIDAFASSDQVHPEIFCARLPVSWTVTEAKKLIAEELGWKGLVLCRKDEVLEDDVNLKTFGFQNLEKIKAVKQSNHRIEFYYQPQSDITSTYSLEVDMNKSVKQVKTQFEKHFQDEVKKQKGEKKSCIHFCFQNRLLQDKECIGLVLRNNIKDEKISVHFGADDSMSIDLKFRTGRKTKHRLVIVPRDISTASLRGEVSKHLAVDPKAVKLTFEDKLIDEHDNLSEVYKDRWHSGCRIAAGIKKYKTLRIKHPRESEEVPFEMYMLEPVRVLKKKIAERWGLNLLQISLFCREFHMENQHLLQHYPIKNNIEIRLELFHHRIVLKVVILYVKKRITLVIDNSFETTVDDLLRFCAHRFDYSRKCSRGIYKDRCMDRMHTLADEGIMSGDTVIVSYFDQSSLLQGDLINVFIGTEDGNLTSRVGAVSAGILLHAPKKVEAPQTEEAVLDNGHVPKGIKVCNEKETIASCLAGHMKSDVNKEGRKNERLLSVQDIKKKAKFLERGRRVIQQRHYQMIEQLKLQPHDTKFYLEASDSENGTEDSPEFDLNEETGKKMVVQSQRSGVSSYFSTTIVKEMSRNNAEKKEELLDTGVKSKVGNLENERTDVPDNVEEPERCAECLRGEITEADCPASTSNEINKQVNCIESCCKKIREVQSAKELTGLGRDLVPGKNQQPILKQESVPTDIAGACYQGYDFENAKTASKDSETECQNVDYIPDNKQELISNNLVTSKVFDKQTRLKQKTAFHHTNDLSNCDTETSGCESSHDKSYKLNIVLSRTDKADDTESSDIDHVTSRHGEDCQCRRCFPTDQYQRCPFMQKFSIRKDGRRIPRTHTVSESALALVDLPILHQYQPQIHFIQTCPNLELRRFTEPNADIETTGITLVRLQYIAKNVGTKWKNLLRKLNIDESTIGQIEYHYNSQGLEELAIQALMAWKREKGTAGTLEILLKAVEDIGFKSVAENFNNIGYATAEF